MQKMAKQQIKLLKNNEKRDWDDLDWIKEFYQFLQGSVPEGITIGHGHTIKLSPKKAMTVIWYLQEKLSILPDHIERCDCCDELYDSYSQGYYSESTGKNYCSPGCEPPGLYEKENKE